MLLDILMSSATASCLFGAFATAVLAPTQSLEILDGHSFLGRRSHEDYINRKMEYEAYFMANHDAWYHRSILGMNSTSGHSLEALAATPAAVTTKASVVPLMITTNDNHQFQTQTELASSTFPSSTVSIQPKKSSSSFRAPASATTTAHQSVDEHNVWLAGASSACDSAVNVLDPMAISTTQSGMIICYNVEKIDMTDGDYFAALNLYQISPPSGAWRELAGAHFSLHVNYEDASIGTTESSSKSNTARRAWPRDAPALQNDWQNLALHRRALPSPLLVLGNVSIEGTSRLNGPLSSADNAEIKAFASPNIILLAETSAGQSVSETMDLQKCSFVFGLVVESNSSAWQTERQLTIASSNDRKPKSARNWQASRNLAFLISILYLISTSFFIFTGLAHDYCVHRRYGKDLKNGRIVAPIIISYD